MFLRGLWDISLNGDLTEISQRHLMPAGCNTNQRNVLTYVLLPIIQRECDTFCCGHTDNFNHDLCGIYQRQFKFTEAVKREVFYTKVALRNFAMFTGKHLCWSLFFNKVAGPQLCNFIKKRFQHRCFTVNNAKFFRTPNLKNICERLLLNSV